MSLLRQGGCRIDAMDVLFFHDFQIPCKVTTKIWNMQDFDFKNQIYLNFYRLRLEIRTKCPRSYNISYGALEIIVPLRRPKLLQIFQISKYFVLFRKLFSDFEYIYINK